MSFTSSLAEFRSFVGVWLDVSDLTQPQIETAITNAERRIERGDGTNQEPGLRVREMETAFSDSITGDGTLALPSDFLELKYAYVNTSPVVKLERRNPDFIYRKYPYRSSGKSKPGFIAREANTFIFGPAPDAEYQVKGVYYKEIPSMVSDGTINGVFSAYPDLYLKATVIECEKLVGRDTRTRLWEADFKRQLQSANLQGEREEYSGPLRVTSDGPGMP